MANKYKDGRIVPKVSRTQLSKQTERKEGKIYRPIGKGNPPNKKSHQDFIDIKDEIARQDKLKKSAAKSHSKVGTKSQKRKYFNNTYEEGK